MLICIFGINHHIHLAALILNRSLFILAHGFLLFGLGFVGSVGFFFFHLALTIPHFGAVSSTGIKKKLFFLRGLKGRIFEGICAFCDGFSVEAALEAPAMDEEHLVNRAQKLGWRLIKCEREICLAVARCYVAPIVGARSIKLTHIIEELPDEIAEAALGCLGPIGNLSLIASLNREPEHHRIEIILREKFRGALACDFFQDAVAPGGGSLGRFSIDSLARGVGNPRAIKEAPKKIFLAIGYEMVFYPHIFGDYLAA